MEPARLSLDPLSLLTEDDTKQAKASQTDDTDSPGTGKLQQSSQEPSTCQEGILTSAGDCTVDSGSGNRRLYVGNLSWTTAWQGLKDHMKQAGEGKDCP
jgi:hypothetical protein